MHRMCIECHCVEESQTGSDEPYLSRCSSCHRSAASEIEVKPELVAEHLSRAEGNSSDDHG
jgi:hypothetical protein